MSFVSWKQPRSSEICDISVEFIQGVIERCTDILTTSYWLIKYDIQGVFLKCAEILPTRL
jgi:hypothetical protein